MKTDNIKYSSLPSELLLLQLMEECAEITQRASKALTRSSRPFLLIDILEDLW